jgi:hypothetical protein
VDILYASSSERENYSKHAEDYYSKKKRMTTIMFYLFYFIRSNFACNMQTTLVFIFEQEIYELRDVVTKRRFDVAN